MIKAVKNLESTSCRINDMQLLRGSFLIASPIIPDDRFKQAVVFICESKTNTTFGFIIDPSEKNTTAKFKKKFKGTMLANVPVYCAGPVEESKLFLLHTTDKTWKQTLVIGDIAITNINDVLSDETIQNKNGLPKEYMIISGFTNWMQLQLEREITLGFWLLAQPSTSIIFDKNIKNKWKYCMDMLQLNTNTYAHYVGTS